MGDKRPLFAIPKSGWSYMAPDAGLLAILDDALEDPHSLRLRNLGPSAPPVHLQKAWPATMIPMQNVFPKTQP